MTPAEFSKPPSDPVPALFYSFGEAVSDLTDMVAHRTLGWRLHEDSREAVNLIINWAWEFEQQQHSWDVEDYFETLGAFFEAKLKEVGK